MRISSPSRNTSARKPSHLGSKIHSSPSGNSLTRLASIGKIGGWTFKFTPHGIPHASLCEGKPRDFNETCTGRVTHVCRSVLLAPALRTKFPFVIHSWGIQAYPPCSGESLGARRHRQRRRESLMTARVQIALTQILLVLALSFSAPAQEVLNVDANANARPFPHFWEQMFGSGRAILSLRDSYREDLREVKQV